MCASKMVQRIKKILNVDDRPLLGIIEGLLKVFKYSRIKPFKFSNRINLIVLNDDS